MTDSADNGLVSEWTPPDVDLDSVKTGDMPGDKIQINQLHVDKATTIFPHLLDRLDTLGDSRFVVSVFGGSGVGKSEIASLLGHYCDLSGFGAYVLSGDNYAHRIPEHNDLERLRAYRSAALNEFAVHPGFTDDRMTELLNKWRDLSDLDPDSWSGSQVEWMTVYHEAGRRALAKYLGTAMEIDFPMVNTIVKTFKEGGDRIALKRMGQTANDRRFESVDFYGLRVLVVEWTHGNNPLLDGVDFPIFLFSTPAETLAHRLARGRDKNTDSPLISRVLEIEHEKLVKQAESAALIISKNGEVLSLPEFRQRAAGQQAQR